MIPEEVVAKLRELHGKVEILTRARYEGRDWRLVEDETMKFVQRNLGTKAARDIYDSFHPGTIAMGGPLSGDGVSPQWKAERVEAIQTDLEILIRDVESGHLQPIEEAATPSPKERYIPSGREYDAYTTIRGIVELAGQSITIVDPYVDRTLLQLLSNAKPNLVIRVLTRRAPADFELEVEKFRKQGFNIETRQGIDDFHDRFILVDSRCIHLGASIKDAGSRGFMIQELEDASNVASIRKNIETAWNGVAPAPAEPSS